MAGFSLCLTTMCVDVFCVDVEGYVCAWTSATRVVYIYFYLPIPVIFTFPMPPRHGEPILIN